MVIIFQITVFMYFNNTNLQIINSIVIIVSLTTIGMLVLLADDGFSGLTELVQCPVLFMTILLQILLLILKNTITQVVSKIKISRLNKDYVELNEWYIDVEDRLAYEQYEDPNQFFSIT